MKHLIATVTVLLLVLGGVALALRLGGNDGPGTGDGSQDDWRDVGTVVTTWSEADEASWASWLTRLLEPRLVTTEKERTALLARVPDAVPGRAEIRAVDLDEQVLLAGGLGKCNEEGVAQASGSTVRYEIRTIGDWDCDWAPLTVEVWQIDRADLGDGTVRTAGAGG